MDAKRNKFILGSALLGGAVLSYAAYKSFFGGNDSTALPSSSSSQTSTPNANVDAKSTDVVDEPPAIVQSESTVSLFGGEDDSVDHAAAEVANKLHKEGIKAFKDGNFDRAVKLFTEAIASNPHYKYYTNRAMAYFQQHEYVCVCVSGGGGGGLPVCASWCLVSDCLHSVRLSVSVSVSLSLCLSISPFV
jgi:tetratricopeptide (TPR) repeat protein